MREEVMEYIMNSIKAEDNSEYNNDDMSMVFSDGTRVEGLSGYGGNIETFVLDCEYGRYGFNGKLDLSMWHKKEEVLSCPNNFIEFSRLESSYELAGLCCVEISQVDL